VFAAESQHADHLIEPQEAGVVRFAAQPADQPVQLVPPPGPGEIVLYVDPGHAGVNAQCHIASLTGPCGSSRISRTPARGIQASAHRAPRLTALARSRLAGTEVGRLRERRRLLPRLLEPKAVAYAHCDLPCGIYDPAQARIEAESLKAIDEKFQQNTDPAFRTRCLIIKEQRSELVKHHLWVLWTDYFKPPHFEKYPQLHTLFNEATKLAGASGTKGSADPAVADQLLAKIEEVSKIFWETKQG
jgi:nickel superoxide dismutase